MLKQLELKSMRVHVQVKKASTDKVISYSKCTEILQKKRTMTKLQLVNVLDALLYNDKSVIFSCCDH